MHLYTAFFTLNPKILILVITFATNNAEVFGTRQSLMIFFLCNCFIFFTQFFFVSVYENLISCVIWILKSFYITKKSNLDFRQLWKPFSMTQAF